MSGSVVGGCPGFVALRPVLFRNPARCAGRVARPPLACAPGRPPVPPCRPSGVRGKSVLPGGFGGSLRGLWSPFARAAVRQALGLALLRAPAWPRRSGSPLGLLGALACGPGGLSPRAAGPGRPLAAGGPLAALPPAASAPGLAPLLLSRLCVAWWGRGPVRPGRPCCHTTRDSQGLKAGPPPCWQGTGAVAAMNGCRRSGALVGRLTVQKK